MIQPGLERISLLLKNVDFPWKAIHVAGTNGKGSVCAYANAMLRSRDIRCGRFTSPHLVDRWDCILINENPVAESKFRTVENYFIRLNKRENIQASEFELLTATAFQLFNDYRVEYGVVEVGMGGLLDATNILENQVVSVITKVAHDHQRFLGSTLDEITRHKAGILRPNVPYIVSPSNEFQVQLVVNDAAKQIGAGPRLDVNAERREELASPEDRRDWDKFVGKIPRAQREAIEVAWLAVREALRPKGIDAPLTSFLYMLRPFQFPGRYQNLAIPVVFGQSDIRVLVDGAHNEDAAKALAAHVDHFTRRSTRAGAPGSPTGGPITWVVGMSASADKDPRDFFQNVLRPGDRLVLTAFGPVDGMPWVRPVPPDALLQAAKDVMGADVVAVTVPEGCVHRALMAAKYLAKNDSGVVLTGSLYLVGDYFREDRRVKNREEGFLGLMREMDQQERRRINYWLSKLGGDEGEGEAAREWEWEEASVGKQEEREWFEGNYRQLLREVKELDRKLKELTETEERLKREAAKEAERESKNARSLRRSSSSPAIRRVRSWSPRNTGEHEEEGEESEKNQQEGRGNPFHRTHRMLARIDVPGEGEGQ